MSAVGKRIKLLRERLGIEPITMANDLNLTVSTIYRMENGDVKPKESNLFKIAQKYNVSRDWLIHGKGELVITPTMNKDEAVIAELRKQIDILQSQLNKAMDHNSELIKALTGPGKKP